MARNFVGEPWVGFLHARDSSTNTWITLGAALLQVAYGFNPVAHAVRSGTVHAVPRREADPFNGHGFLYAGGIYAGIVQDDGAPEGMADEPNRKIVDDVEKRRQIENMLGNAIDGTGRPSAIAVAAQIERVYVIVLAQDLGDPVPIARMVERAVHEDQRGLAVLAVVPKLEFETVGIEEVRDGFHFWRLEVRVSEKA